MLGGAGYEAGGLETDAHPAEVDGPEDAEIEAQPDFCKGLFSCSPEGLTAGEETLGGGASLIPAAFANLRISFSSRLRSFSLRRSASSLPPIFMGWFAFMSFMRALWWCAYEFVCSSYCATFLNCLSQSSQ